MDGRRVLVRNYLYNVAYQVLVLLAPLVTAPYLARVLGAECLGIYGYIAGVSSVMQTVMMLGLYTYGNRQIAYSRDDPDAVNRAFWELMSLRCFCGAIGLVAYIAFAIGSKYRLYAFAYLPWLVANILDISWLFVGFEDMKPTVMKNAGIKLASILGILIFIKEQEDLWLYFLLISVGTLLGNISLYPYAGKYVSFPELKANGIAEHLKGSVSLFIPEAAASLLLQVNRVLLGSVLPDADQTGFYDQGDKIVNIPMTFVTVFSTVMMPRVAHEVSAGSEESAGYYVVEAGKPALMIAIPLSLGIAGSAANLVPWFLGPGFEPVIPVVQILSPIVVANCLMGMTGSQYLTARNETRFLSFVNAIGLMLVLMLDALVIRSYGALGAATSIVVSRFVVSILQLVKVRNNLPLRKLIRPCVHYIAAAMIMLVVIEVDAFMVPHGAVLTIVQFVTGVLTYFTILKLLKDETVGVLLGAVGARKLLANR